MKKDLLYEKNTEAPSMAALTSLLSEWINGERAVVCLYIARIVSAAPLSLLPESFSLFLLSLFAFFLDISADYNSGSSGDGKENPFSNIFKTRRGVTSGIFLGAVTLPGLMLSRLIQMSRGVSKEEVGVSDIGYHQLLFWTTSTCNFSMLIFLFLVLFRDASEIPFIPSRVKRNMKLSSRALYAGACCIIFAAKSSLGWQMALTLLWVISHGLAASKLVQNILRTFPACVSIGEALLVTAGLVIYSGDMIFYTSATVIRHIASPKRLSVSYHIKRSQISTIIQGVTLGLLLLPFLFKYSFQVFQFFKFLNCSSKRRYQEIKKSCIFYASLAFILFVVVPSWMQFVLDFGTHPILWVFDFVFSESLIRLLWCLYWVAILCVFVPIFYSISKNSKTERILLRKYYHLVAVVMFVPVAICQPKFLHLAFGAALAVFLVLEIIRVWRIWPLGQLVHQFMNAFTDHRDSEILIVSHFSLLLGCALPIWLSSGFNDRPLAPFAGILSLGIGDTMASMVGYKYGVLRWSKTGKKTIEGTAAGISSVLAACTALLYFLARMTGYVLTLDWSYLLVAVITSGLLEAYTTQLDNAFVPLVFYSHLCL